MDAKYTKWMATAILLLVAALRLAAVQQPTINLAVIPAGIEAYPSQEELRNNLQKVSKDVQTTLSHLSFITKYGDGLWHQVAYLNMSDPLQQCPSAWRLYSTNGTNGVRACGRPVTSRQSCPAVHYPTSHQYHRVCGRIIGYQVATPGAFHSVNADRQPTTLDDPYVDGVSVTYGHPHSHIWTLAAGVTEGSYFDGAGPDCPCSRSGATQAPDYVDNNYYCESGNSDDRGILGHLYSSDPLWDGQQCEGQCCENGKSPPWFSVQLPNPTLDDIEVRICGDESTDNEDTPVELIEIYVS